MYITKESEMYSARTHTAAAAGKPYTFNCCIVLIVYSVYAYKITMRNN